MSRIDKIPTDYTAIGIVLGGLVSYAFGTWTWNLITTGTFTPKGGDSTTSKIIGLGFAGATVTGRVWEFERERVRNE
mgnify:CR=1 FL=1